MASCPGRALAGESICRRRASRGPTWPPGMIAAIVDALGGREQLDGQNDLQVAQNASRLARRNRPVADVVFPVGAGRNGVRAGGMRQRLVLRRQGCGRVLPAS